MSVPIVSTHVADAQGNLLYQYQNAPFINGFVQAIVQPVQELEDAAQTLTAYTSITSGYGSQLDGIGKIVGIARVPGQTDDQYRISLYGQIGANRSNGRIEDAIGAFLIYTGASDCTVWEFFPAAYFIQTSFQFASPAMEASAAAYVQQVSPIGVRFMGFQPNAPIIQFAFDGPQFGNLGAGFGDLNDQTTGGFWSDELDPTVPT